MVLSLRLEMEERLSLSNMRSAIDYLRVLIGDQNCEQVRLLMLDAKLRLIRDDELSRGTPDQSSLIVRDVVTRSLEAGAVSIILAHNHPSGDCKPSDADRVTTRRLQVAAHAVGINLADHLIVTANDFFSFRAENLI